MNILKIKMATGKAFVLGISSAFLLVQVFSFPQEISSQFNSSLNQLRSDGNHDRNETEDVDESDFPSDLFSIEVLRKGAILLHVIGALYSFVVTGIICGDYFLPSVDCICTALNLTQDVAAAAFMSFATTAPELFVILIATFCTNSDLGVGAVVGSAMFNILGVATIGGLAAPMAIKLDWWPLFRDGFIYMGAVTALAGVMLDGYVTLAESIGLILYYFVYFIIMFSSKRIRKRVEGCGRFCFGKIKAKEEKKPSARPPSITPGDEKTEEPARKNALTITSAQDEKESDDGDSQYKPFFVHYEDCISLRRLSIASRPSHVDGRKKSSFRPPNFDGRRSTVNRGGSITADRKASAFRGPDFEGRKSTVTRGGSITADKKASAGAGDNVENRKSTVSWAGSVSEDGKASASRGANVDIRKSTVSWAGSVSGGRKSSAARGADIEERKSTASGGGSITADRKSSAGMGANIEGRKSGVGLGGFFLGDRKASATTGANFEGRKSAIGVAGIASADRKASAATGANFEGRKSAVGVGGFTSADRKVSKSFGSDAKFSDFHPAEIPQRLESVAEDFPVVFQSIPEQTIPEVDEEMSQNESISVADEEFEEIQDFKTIFFTFPSGSTWKKLSWLSLWPISFLFYWTIPDCRMERWRKYFPVTFLMCIFWIGITTYFGTWMIYRFGKVVGISDSVMGLTFLAVGGGMPEAVSVFILARQGEGGLGFSTSLGGNTMDVCLCLGLPWLIKSISQGSVKIYSHCIEYNTVALLIGVLVLVFVLIITKFRLNKTMGLICCTSYSLFLTLSILIEMKMIKID